MVLKRIEIFGFKSFPDRTILDFPEGITAIVGANGCGKSNVSDAIRWVLGEQSAKSLRGDNMQDLIFTGTATRKPMHVAEVILTFDNSRGLFPIGFTEVSIGRRLFRSGESHYLLNKQECRLRDVYDLLMDSGIGRRAHAIIEQGKIDEIVTARPEERRALIEEAAGIAKYRSRRTEALRKLDATREGLRRVDDILGEMERQEGTLKRQAKKAERFREFETELRVLDVAVSGLQLDSIAATRGELAAAREEAVKGSVEAEAEMARLALETEAVKMRLDEAREALRVSGRALSETERETSAIEAQIGEMEARHADDMDAAGRLAREIEMLETRLAAAEESRVAAVDEAEMLAARIVAVETDLLSASDASATAAAELGSARSARLGQEERLRELTERATRAGSELEHLTRRRTERETAVARAEERQAEEAVEIERFRARQDELSAEITACDLERDCCTGRRREIEERLEETRTRLETAGFEAGILDRDRALIEARLQEAEAEARSIGEEATRLSEEANVVVASLLDSLHCDAAILPAVAAALGEAARGLVVATGDRDILKTLATRLPGRFLIPENRLNVATAAWRPIEDARPLRDLIEIGDGARSLLAGWYLAATIEEGVALLERIDERDRVVTEAGEVLSPSGALRAARPAEADDFGEARLAMAREIEGLAARQAELRAESARLKIELADLETERRGIESRGRELLEKRSALQSDSTVLAERLDALAASDVAARIERLRVEIAEMSARRIELEETVAAAAAEREALALMTEELDGHVRSAAERDDEARRRGAVLETELARIRERHEGRAAESVRLGVWIEDTAATRERHHGMRAEILGRVERLDGALAGLRRRLAELSNLLDERQRDFARCETVCRDLDVELAGVEKARRTATSERERLTGLLHQSEMEAVRLEGESARIRERILDRYGIEPGAGAVLPEGVNREAAEARTEELREMIQRMGGVNFEAADELVAVEERLRGFRSQREDLARAETGLASVIKDIDEKTVRLFSETFQAVNTNFALLFNRLFGARSSEESAAELVLLDPSNPLESGVDIIARPPGKKPQTISLLSGGEKALTAVALLFAVFLVRPSPFAVLDELDAPLDDANVGKYVQLLREFSLRTQFIIVTHNKRTMEAADTLHGVSQIEKGISRIIGVRLSEEMAEALPEAAG